MKGGGGKEPTSTEHPPRALNQAVSGPLQALSLLLRNIISLQGGLATLAKMKESRFREAR